MRVTLELTSFNVRGRPPRALADTWLWPVFFVVDDRLLPAARRRVPRAEALTRAEPVSAAGLAGGPDRDPDGPGFARWSTRVTADALGAGRARVGYALLATAGAPRRPAVRAAVDGFVSRLRVALTRQLGAAPGLGALSSIAVRPAAARSAGAGPLEGLAEDVPDLRLTALVSGEDAHRSDVFQQIAEILGLSEVFLELEGLETPPPTARYGRAAASDTPAGTDVVLASTLQLFTLDELRKNERLGFRRRLASSRRRASLSVAGQVWAAPPRAPGGAA